MKPIVAIVGRPNVGKSQLFNKLVGRRVSIVEDTPGVTRDRIYGETDWNGRQFTLIDTGGIEPRTDNLILEFMREQAQTAIETATVIIFLTDVRTGLTSSDHEVANMLLRSGKPIVLAVNKMDSTGTPDPDFYEFYNLGLGDPIAVSAVHGHGTGDLLDACVTYFPPVEDEEEEDDAIHVAVIGKPNAGKSSLVNRILGEERVIVSDVAGTTRDAIDSRFENDKGSFVFIDTAGIRRRSKVSEDIEKYSVLRATMAIERADVCLILIDATEGVTEQDTKVAGLAHEAGKASIIVVNKWDLIEKDGKTMDRMREEVRQGLSFMVYAPILFISAKTGQRVDRLFELIDYVSNQAATRITTGMLNNVLADAQTRVQPPTDKGRRLKIYYMTQVGVKPPHFVVFCNDTRLFHFSYQRYLENCIRNTFGLEGTPVILSVRQRGEKEEELHGKLVASDSGDVRRFSIGRLSAGLLQRCCHCLQVYPAGRCTEPRQRQRGAHQLLPHFRRPADGPGNFDRCSQGSFCPPAWCLGLWVASRGRPGTVRPSYRRRAVRQILGGPLLPPGPHVSLYVQIQGRQGHPLRRHHRHYDRLAHCLGGLGRVFAADCPHPVRLPGLFVGRGQFSFRHLGVLPRAGDCGPGFSLRRACGLAAPREPETAFKRHREQIQLSP